MRQHIRLYNVLFPLWFFWLYPTKLWLLILPANFLLDSLVLYAAMRRRHIEARAALWKSSILRVWVFGFLSDICGAALILFLHFALGPVTWFWDAMDFYLAEALLVLPGVALAGFLIYFFNQRYTFSSCGLPPEEIRRLSLVLAVFTAPYAMFIPLSPS